MAKKDFKKNNPALQFISGATDNKHNTEHTEYMDSKLNTHNKYNTNNIDNRDNKYDTQNTATESKSKRLNLLVYPSLLEDLKKIATMERKSVNELINTVLLNYADKNKDQIERYDGIFNA